MKKVLTKKHKHDKMTIRYKKGEFFMGKIKTITLYVGANIACNMLIAISSKREV